MSKGKKRLSRVQQKHIDIYSIWIPLKDLQLVDTASRKPG
jgi:hypothetical protein